MESGCHKDNPVLPLLHSLSPLLTFHGVVSPPLHDHLVEEVYMSAANNGKPLDQEHGLRQEALAAWEEAQASLAALIAAGRRSDDSGAAVSLPVVAENVEKAAAKLAQMEPGCAVADRLLAGALARVCLDGTVSGEAVQMVVYAVEVIRGDQKKRKLADAQLMSAASHLALMLAVRRHHPHDLVVAEHLIVNTLADILQGSTQEAQDRINDKTLRLLPYGSELIDVCKLVWPSFDIKLDAAELPVAGLVYPVEPGMKDACRDECGLYSYLDEQAPAEGLQVEGGPGKFTNYANLDMLVKKVLPGNMDMSTQPCVIVEAKHYTFRHRSANVANAELDPKGVDGSVPCLDNHEVAEVLLAICKLKRPEHYAACCSDFTNAVAKLFLGTPAEELYMLFLVPLHLFAREAGGRLGWKDQVDISIRVKNKQLVLYGTGSRLMSATQCIGGGSPILISGAMGVLHKFFEPGWKLRTAADVDERRPQSQIGVKFLKDTNSTSLAASFLGPAFVCHNCSKVNPPKGNTVQGVPLCDACGQYLKRTGTHRPQRLFAKATK